MSTSLKFYADAGLTQELGQLVINQLANGSTPDVDNVVYLGSTVTGSVFEAQSDPGVDDIVVSIVDDDPGNGVEVSDIRLALTQAGLNTATPGEPLVLGPEINAGAGNAIPVYVRSATPAIAASSTEISLETNDVIESVGGF
ncbi:hypothetical protein [Methylophaga lonarensis]|uniref:hypothetical protein n=1 Tax=Methylophaga lonarensis TaxID=999151 RepID=UPI003D2B0C79